MLVLFVSIVVVVVHSLVLFLLIFAAVVHCLVLFLGLIILLPSVVSMCSVLPSDANCAQFCP